MRLRCSVPTLDAKDSRENEDLPEDRDQCRRRTGKQRSEEEEQEGTEVRRRCYVGEGVYSTWLDRQKNHALCIQYSRL